MNSATGHFRPETQQAGLCPECGIELQGRYCHECGARQPDHHDLELGHFLHHALHEVTHLDSKIFRTSRALVLEPGLLTTEYLAGRKQRYFLPLRLFLVIFAVNLFLYTRPGVSTYDMRFLAKNDRGLVQRKLEQAAAKRQLTMEELSDRINMHWEKDLSLLQFGDVFFFAVVAAIVFHNRRRYFVEHLIFSLHILSFVLLLGTIPWLYYALVGLHPTFLVLGLSSIVYVLYLHKATTRVYNATKGEAWVKSLVLVAGLVAVRFFFVVVTLLIALFQTLS
jgi:hypothetical protein